LRAHNCQLESGDGGALVSNVSNNNLGAENALTVGLKVPPEVETVVLCNTGIHLTDDELSDRVGSSLSSCNTTGKSPLMPHT